MRFSQAVIVYFIMGAVLWGAGVVPFHEETVGLVTVFVEQDEGGGFAADDQAILPGDQAEDTGILGNLIGPVENALATVAGGTVLAVWQAIDSILGFFAWPVTTAQYIGAPVEVVLLSATLMLSFVFGVLRIFRRGT